MNTDYFLWLQQIDQKLKREPKNVVKPEKLKEKKKLDVTPQPHILGHSSVPGPSCRTFHWAD
jgi:hypothetical protein